MRMPKVVFQQLGRNLGAAGGGVGPKYQPHPQAVKQSAVEGVQHRLALNRGHVRRQPVDGQR